MAKCKDVCFEEEARNKVSVESQTTTPNEYGDMQPVWAEVVAPWAIIMPKNVTELLENGQLTAKVVHKIIVRYDARINPSCRILFESRRFNILGIRNLDEDMSTEGKYYMELTAQEGEKS